MVSPSVIGTITVPAEFVSDIAQEAILLESIAVVENFCVTPTVAISGEITPTTGAVVSRLDGKVVVTDGVAEGVAVDPVLEFNGFVVLAAALTTIFAAMLFPRFPDVSAQLTTATTVSAVLNVFASVALVTPAALVTRVIGVFVEACRLSVRIIKHDDRLTSSETVDVSVASVPTVATSGETTPIFGAVVSATAVVVADVETVITAVVPRVEFPTASLHMAAAPYFPADLNVVDTVAVVPATAVVNVIAVVVTILFTSVSNNLHEVTSTLSATVEESVTAVPTTAILGVIALTTGGIVSTVTASVGVVGFVDGEVLSVAVGTVVVVVVVSVDVGIDNACANCGAGKNVHMSSIPVINFFTIIKPQLRLVEVYRGFFIRWESYKRIAPNLHVTEQRILIKSFYYFDTMKNYVQWILRIGIAGEFIGHGMFALQGKVEWVGWIVQFLGVTTNTATIILRCIGIIDQIVAGIVLFAPIPAVLLWAVLCGSWTAILRPLVGESIWEFVARWPNWAGPLALLMMNWPKKSAKAWFSPIVFK